MNCFLRYCDLWPTDRVEKIYFGILDKNTPTDRPKKVFSVNINVHQKWWYILLGQNIFYDAIMILKLTWPSMLAAQLMFHLRFLKTSCWMKIYKFWKNFFRPNGRTTDHEIIYFGIYGPIWTDRPNSSY